MRRLTIQIKYRSNLWYITIEANKVQSSRDLFAMTKLEFFRDLNNPCMTFACDWKVLIFPLLFPIISRFAYLSV